MKVYHFNCASMTSIGGQIGNERQEIPLVTHCLLIEHQDSLVLVDSGFGVDDVNQAEQRMSPDFIRIAQPALDLKETAIHQVQALGFEASDVRHIVLTHLHHDHAGGLADFPHAQVHVGTIELEAALNPASAHEKLAYQPLHWAHDPQWVSYDADGEDWFGFTCARPLQGLHDDIALVPLFGHSRGHCGVAVRTGNRWLFNAGDAYFYHGEMDPENPHSPPAYQSIQRAVQIDAEAREQNNARLVDLIRNEPNAVEVFCTHDPVELRRYQ